jgi:hypothetical protein
MRSIEFEFPRNRKPVYGIGLYWFALRVAREPARARMDS